MPHTYDYPRPALTVDCVVFGLDDNDLKVLLIERDLEPYAGQWALPGGFGANGTCSQDRTSRSRVNRRYRSGIRHRTGRDLGE